MLYASPGIRLYDVIAAFFLAVTQTLTCGKGEIPLFPKAEWLCFSRSGQVFVELLLRTEFYTQYNGHTCNNIAHVQVRWQHLKQIKEQHSFHCYYCMSIIIQWTIFHFYKL